MTRLKLKLLEKDEHILEDLSRPHTWGGSHKSHFFTLHQPAPALSFPVPPPPAPPRPPHIIQQTLPQQPATLIQQLPQQQPLITQIPPPQPYPPPCSGGIKEVVLQMAEAEVGMALGLGTVVGNVCERGNCLEGGLGPLLTSSGMLSLLSSLSCRCHVWRDSSPRDCCLCSYREEDRWEEEWVGPKMEKTCQVFRKCTHPDSAIALLMLDVWSEAL
ncbi:putative protein C21orf58 [Liparis tanakae]|uniref:Uncharacterized protein n=1 Tax=Liparis tanakae TaxID=230148 RepID=A0A4Z2IW83_9TELE|nr:putative protein C21orf58 [Liparis tanakae]